MKLLCEEDGQQTIKATAANCHDRNSNAFGPFERIKTDKQTNKKTNTQRYRQTNRKTDKQTNKQTNRQRDKQKDKQTNLNHFQTFPSPASLN